MNKISNLNRVPMLDFTRLNTADDHVDIVERPMPPEEREIVRKNAVRISREENKKLLEKYNQHKSSVCVIQ